MLDQETIQIIKSVAPIVQEHSEAITSYFYERMFTHNPEVSPLFNSAHQQSSTQQRALASAITAYASNIDNLAVLNKSIEIIAQKHASLIIKPEHYPIVKVNLLAAIRQVLDDKATDDIINAWAKAYDFLAKTMIDREKQIYEENSKKPGGWEGFKPFRILRKENESRNIVSLYLVPIDVAPLPTFKPGQYITIRTATANGSTTMRNYSLSDQPGQKWFRISVKREPSPKAGISAGYISNLLHDHMAVDDIIEVAPPCGEFFFDVDKKHQRPLVLLAGGIGITPIYSILCSALDNLTEHKITLIHAILNEDVQAFRSSLDAYQQKHPNLGVYYRYSDAPKAGVIRENNSSTGFVTTEYLESILHERDADYYFCGPQPFMISIYRHLAGWNIPESQVNFEFFGPRQDLHQ